MKHLMLLMLSIQGDPAARQLTLRSSQVSLQLHAVLVLRIQSLRQGALVLPGLGKLLVRLGSFLALLHSCFKHALKLCLQGALSAVGRRSLYRERTATAQQVIEARL